MKKDCLSNDPFLVGDKNPEKHSCVREPGSAWQAKQAYHTIDEILALPEGVRAELIDGKIYYMAAPTRTHQQILVEMTYLVVDYIKKHHGQCQVYPAPFALYLHADNSIYLEPDLTVVCNPDKLDEKGCHGAPDWVVEIASPSSYKLDSSLKLVKYRDAGVREYWLILPDQQCVDVYTFAECLNQKKRYSFADTIYPFLFPDLPICLGG